jgi:hypothetical protein
MVKNVDLWQRLDQLLRAHTLTAEWVRGHAGHHENERCDQLATGAIAVGGGEVKLQRGSGRRLALYAAGIDGYRLNPLFEVADAARGCPATASPVQTRSVATTLSRRPNSAPVVECYSRARAPLVSNRTTGAGGEQ